MEIEGSAITWEQLECEEEIVVNFINTFDIPEEFPNDDTIKKRIISLCQTLYAKHQKLRALLASNQMIIDLFEQDDQLSHQLAIIKHFTLFRNSDCTCPVKTLVLFSSTKPVSFEENILSVFDDVASVADFVKMYSEKTASFPRICSTTIQPLFKYSKYYLDPMQTECEIVMFKNESNHLDTEIKPMFWLHFVAPDNLTATNEQRIQYENEQFRQTFTIDFPTSNVFSGSYVAVKMIDCYKTSQHNDTACNMDIGFVSFKGNLLPLKTKQNVEMQL